MADDVWVAVVPRVDEASVLVLGDGPANHRWGCRRVGEIDGISGIADGFSTSLTWIILKQNALLASSNYALNQTMCRDA